MLRVIDISDAQAGLDLSTIANQFDAVMIKATGGNGYVNPYCDGWVQQAIALGKKWGVYHYFSDGYNDGDPIAEANWFFDNCQGYVGQGIMALDWERGGNPDVNNTAKAQQFTQHLKSRTGINPGDYMSQSLVVELDWSGSVSDGNWLWCADYVDDNTIISNFNMDSSRDPNPHWDGDINDVMWQFTSHGHLDGYGGNLDCSFFYGTQAAWDAYAGVHSTAPPQPAPEPALPAEPTPVEITPTPVVSPAPAVNPQVLPELVSNVPPTPVATPEQVATWTQPTKKHWYDFLIQLIVSILKRKKK